jgi:hypothetical protein
MDKHLLNYRIGTKGVTTDSFCEQLGLSKSAFYRKRNGRSEFSAREIRDIKNLLQLSDNEVDAIFFDGDPAPVHS